MVVTLSAVLLFLVTVTGNQPALATSFTTIFGPGGVAGNPPDPSVLNGLDAFTQFNGGGILFFQKGNFYVGGPGPAAGNVLSAQGLANFGRMPQVNNRISLINSGAANSAVTLGELTVVKVSEPPTLLLFGSGLVGLALWRLRTRRQS